MDSSKLFTAPEICLMRNFIEKNGSHNFNATIDYDWVIVKLTSCAHIHSSKCLSVRIDGCVTVKINLVPLPFQLKGIYFDMNFNESYSCVYCSRHIVNCTMTFAHISSTDAYWSECKNFNETTAAITISSKMSSVKENLRDKSLRGTSDKAKISFYLLFNSFDLDYFVEWNALWIVKWWLLCRFQAMNDEQMFWKC